MQMTFKRMTQHKEVHLEESKCAYRPVEKMFIYRFAACQSLYANLETAHLGKIHPGAWAIFANVNHRHLALTAVASRFTIRLWPYH